MATAKKSPAKKAPAKKAAAKTPRGVKQDRALVAAHQEYEVSYVAKVSGTTAAKVKEAIKAQGHSRVKVVKALGGKKK